MSKCTLLVFALSSTIFFTESANAQEWSSTTVASSSALWPNTNLKDGNIGTTWTSNGYADANHTEWVAYWFDGFRQVNYIKLFPRIYSGSALGFPKDFSIYWSDGARWNLARTYTNFETPQNADYVILPLPATVNANGIYVAATRLGADNVNNYYFQINEVGAGFNPLLAKLSYVTNTGTPNEVEIRNTGSDAFDPSKMKVFNYDKRNPIISAKSERNPDCLTAETVKNVYAPSVVYKGPNNWDVFFGGWDGRCPSSRKDTVSRLNTADNFSTFGAHTEIVSNGALEHVNNGSVVRTAAGTWHMAYTTYPEKSTSGPSTLRRNKPGYATSSDGVNWDPTKASPAKLINVNRYPGTWGDLNSGLNIDGSNVLYSEGSNLYFYWTSIPSPLDGAGGDRAVHWASGTDGISFNYGGKLYDRGICKVINDVKKIASTYLFAYHCNTNKVWYSTSNIPNPASLPEPGEVFDTKTPLLGPDPYVATAGWVTNGARLFGILYGAGIVEDLDQNRIFARWLQKKAVIRNSGTILQSNLSNGPDNTVVMMVPGQGIQTAIINIYDTDGSTLLYSSPPLTFRQGDVWQYNP